MRTPFDLPLFPLHTVLFPGGLLPLRIFELRYLEMIRRAHREGTPFGVVALLQGTEVQRPAEAPVEAGGTAYADERFAEVGTLASVTALHNPHPGLLTARCVGTQRFRWTDTQRQQNGLWLARATLLEPDTPLPVPADLAATANMLRNVLAAIEQQVSDADQRPVVPPYHLDDCAWLANTWCSLLPVPQATKQRLLETESPLLRLELVADMLERIRPA